MDSLMTRVAVIRRSRTARDSDEIGPGATVTVQMTVGSPLSALSGCPSCAHAVIPPARFTAGNPCSTKKAVARADRPPLRLDVVGQIGQRHVAGAWRVTRGPLVILSNVEQQCALLGEVGRFSDVNVSDLWHLVSFGSRSAHRAAKPNLLLDFSHGRK